MGEVVNLRMARKRHDRAEKERIAAENRVLHGRSKADRKVDEAERQRGSLLLDGHRRDRPEGTR
ncbi:DUF4169 family protein [Aquibium carbonis]|uniref:DUF4169 family protein n=1 Tax=Aquibium carbonis TaxID=2495581 RepID=A0A3R9YD47_9HYPH|nr:DUF4169 family protein [Aquibium carbonis]RST84848.1 DUF4169 family protein [Aquibium carbonis]